VALALITLAAMLWGGAMLVLAGEQGVRADSALTFHDEDILLLVTADDGNQYYVAISMLIGDNGEGGYEEAVHEAHADLIARFPGAVVLDGYEQAEAVGELEKQVHQYVTNNVWWADHTASWKYNGDGGPGVAGEQGAVSAGADTWALSGAQFAFSGGGSTSTPSSACSGGSGLDGENVVAWVPQGGSTLGVTCTWYETEGSPRPLIEFDMELDPGWDWTTAQAASAPTSRASPRMSLATPWALATPPSRRP
jgi:hypothetical protein